MKILLAPLLLAVSLPAFAEVDSKIHKLCIEAKDYAGCVRAMKGETSTETTVNQIQRQGANLTEGNLCPVEHRSSGGGYCQRIICVKAGLFGYGHSQGLGGIGNSCRGGTQLTWDNNHQPIRASFDKNCPPGDLDIGFASTCSQAVVRGYFDAYSLGYAIHKKGLPRSPATKTNKVTEIFGSPAKGNLQIGDKIISENGLKKGFSIDMHKPKTVQVVIERQGEIYEYTFVSEMQRESFISPVKDKL